MTLIRPTTTEPSTARPAMDHELDRRGLFRGLGAVGVLAAAGALVPASRALAADPMASISRDEVRERAMFWVDDPRPYSMDASSEGIDGKQWRTDCSGFVCMAWNLRRTDGDIGTGTGQLPEVLEQIGKDDLLIGDALMITPWDNNAGYGHVVLFNGWTDDARTEYEALEQVGGSISQTAQRTVPYPYDTDNADLYLPYRYPQITG